jgi:CheY-like chemotaxis protein
MGNTILLADKSSTIQKIVQLTFADDNYNIHSVSDGDAALDAILQVHPDLVLADISLPLKSGYDICSAIRKDVRFSECSAIPVILLAGIYETMDEERAHQVEERVKQVEANDFLSKPFDPQLLISKVKHYLSGVTPESSASTSVFTQETESAINLFDTEPVLKPEESEKTMVLPGGPFETMFSPESHETSKPELDIDAVKPVGEVVFGEDALPAVELGAEEEEEKSLFGAPEEMEVATGEEGLFAGRQEQEFEYTSGPVLEVSPTSESEGSIPLILPSADEPFGDVFQEPQSEMQWGSPSVSEEDSPFGMPEPPPAPREPIQEVEAPIEIQRPEAFAEPLAAVEPEPLISTEPVGFDDTWPGLSMKGNKAQPVEELFESDVATQAEDAEELEPDLSESVQEKVAERQAETSAAPAQISEELIDRIAEKVLNKLSERVISEIVWQVVPDLAEKMIRRELEKLHAGEE